MAEIPTDPAALLREAAKVLRESGSQAQPGPWAARPSIMPGEASVSHALKGGRLSPHRVATTHGLYCADADATWIALASPALAEPLADLLDDSAGLAQRIYDDGDLSETDADDLVRDCCDYPLAIARVIMEGPPWLTRARSSGPKRPGRSTRRCAMDEPDRGHTAKPVYGPLINRVINGELRRWLDTQVGLCEASEPTEEGRGALTRVRVISLAYPDTQVTPRIVDALRRAGLLADPVAAQHARLTEGIDWPALWARLNSYVNGSDDELLNAVQLRAYLAELHEELVAEPRRRNFAVEFGEPDHG